MKKILLIEDTQNVLENIAEILELAGYEVCSADNGKRGLELAANEKPDLIICDIQMRQLDGFAVLDALNRNMALGPIPFIFLTAKAERSEKMKGMEMGASEFIVKPFDGSDLLKIVEGQLQKKRHAQTTSNH